MASFFSVSKNVVLRKNWKNNEKLLFVWVEFINAGCRRIEFDYCLWAYNLPLLKFKLIDSRFLKIGRFFLEIDIDFQNLPKP